MLKIDTLTHEIENVLLKLIAWWFASLFLDLNCTDSSSHEENDENKKVDREHQYRANVRYLNVHCG